MDSSDRPMPVGLTSGAALLDGQQPCSCVILTLSEEDPLTKFVDYLKQQLNIDVSPAVVKSTLQLLEHDVSDNCYITYGE